MQKEKMDLKIRQTGTTTVGMVCKDCVVLAAETKSTLGSMISSKEAQKIYPVDDKMAVTISGAVGDAQALIRILSAEINIYNLTRSSEITVKAATTLLSNLMNSYRYYPYIAMLIIGGADKNGYHVFSIDPFGGVEQEKVTSTGSGSPFAYGVLENEYREGMTKEEGIKLAVRAIRAARERDVYSGGKEIRVIVIDKTGIEHVDKEKIKELAQ